MNTVYTNPGFLSSPAIILFEFLLGKDLTNDYSIYVNRESSWHQRNHHAPKIQILREAHADFGNGTPYVPYYYTGTGNLRFLYDKGRKGRYFRWLRKRIEEGLQQTPQGTLYVFAATFARLFRPSGFDPNDEATWTFTDADYRKISDWLIACFGNRAKDIVFVVVFDGTPIEIRRIETVLTTHDWMSIVEQTTKIKKTRVNKIMREHLKMITEFLLGKGKSVQKIHQYFENLGVTITVRAIQRWAEAAGYARPPGRPRGSTHPL